MGPTGKVVGVGLRPQMVGKARRNAGLLGQHNAEPLHAGIEKLPQPYASGDVVISNGVFNLRPDKPKVPAEAFRVLRPGGRLRTADALPHDGVTPEEVAHQGGGRTESPGPPSSRPPAGTSSRTGDTGRADSPPWAAAPAVGCPA